MVEAGKHDDIGVDEGGAVKRLFNGGGRGLLDDDDEALVDDEAGLLDEETGLLDDEEGLVEVEKPWVYAPELDCEWECRHGYANPPLVFFPSLSPSNQPAPSDDRLFSPSDDRLSPPSEERVCPPTHSSSLALTPPPPCR